MVPPPYEPPTIEDVSMTAETQESAQGEQDNWDKLERQVQEERAREAEKERKAQ